MFRQDFPILNDINNPVVYLDNGATTQKPQAVINAVRDYYIAENANPLRGLYSLSVKATEAYEKARQSVAKFINAKESCEIISNILPWQMVAKAKKATLKYMYTDVEGNISDEEILSKITEKTKIVSITQVSNVLGVKTPLEKIIKRAHAVGAIVVVDGAQGAPHLATDVQKLDCDFYAFSGHKMLAPMGIGVLYGKKSLLEEMPPFLRGGEMIDMVTEQDATFAPLPEKFEAGTPNVSGAIGLKAAIDYLNNVGFDKIEAQEKELMDLAYTELAKIPYVTIYGPKNPALRYGVLSFNIEGVHPHDVSSLVDYHGNIALRAGHHCAQPLLKFLKTPSTNRISFYFYNTKEDVYKFIEQIKQVRKWMGYND